MAGIAYSRSGAGPPLVLIHAAGMSRRAWDPVVPLLEGEREVIAIARALLGAPLLVLDEPTTHLDEAAVTALMTGLTRLPRSPTILLVAHDPQVAVHVVRVSELRDGRVVSDSGGRRGTSRRRLPRAGLSIRVHVAESLGELDPLLPGWDRLAEANGKPYCRPAWLLEWWRARNAAQSPRDRLRVVLVCDEEGLAGVAPMFVEAARRRVAHWRLLGQGTFPGVGLLVRPEGAENTIHLIARAIASSCPAPGILSIHAVDVDCTWPEALARSWPGRRALLREGSRTTATSIRLDGVFDDWLRGCGRSWASEHRRRRRRLTDRGGVVRRAHYAEDVNRGLAALIRLHEARWAPQSRWLSPVVDRTLRVAGECLAARDGFRLWLVELDGRVIAASAFAVAGRTLNLLMTAFDPEWRSFGPGLISILAGIEEAFQLGDEVVDLSFGAYPYKLRLANEVRWIHWLEMFPRDRRYPLARAHALPWHAREAVDRARARVQARTRLAQARTRLGETVGRGVRR